MTQPASPVLVTGATGNTGRAPVENLVRSGVPVRAMVRTEAGRRGTWRSSPATTHRPSPAEAARGGAAPAPVPA
jgi:uncharacterized protein YbjT (DUF2867 family)